MGIETEKKYLVNFDEWQAISQCRNNDVRITDYKHLTQGYLKNGPDCYVRIRTTLDGNDSSNRAGFVTIKGPRVGITCAEFEYEIPYDDAQQLLELCPTTLDKIRHNVVDQWDQHWEVDQFFGINSGLFVAELELEDPEQVIVLPSFVDKDVSTDVRYTNVMLIHTPAPQT